MNAPTAAGATPSPEIANSVITGKVATNYHDVGAGKPVLLIHGSGPGVSSWANWRLVLPRLSGRARVVAPDMVGFGYSVAPPEAVRFDLDLWIGQLTALLDKLGLDKVSIIGNSFGGGIALHFAARYPERVEKIILMGSVGASFPLTEGLDRVWGYEPSFENMRELIQLFAFNQKIVTDDLVNLRYQASLRDDVQERFAALFPAPRQRWIDRLAVSDTALRGLPHEILILHGREDRVIPLAASETLAALIPNSRLRIFERCGHWVQIEYPDDFAAEVISFLGI